MCCSGSKCCLLCSILIIVGVLYYVNEDISSRRHRKTQQAIFQLECELGVIMDAKCPLDGGWAPWGPWTNCHGPCDDIGHRRRYRQCTNPPPSKGGLPCNGNNEERELCFLNNCTVENFRAIVAGDPTRTQAFRLLQAVPAMMERCLQMECPYEAIEAALSSDNTWQLNPECLWNALQCVKRNLGCPVPGEWGTWGSWSACGARCGKGVRWRLRRCDSPPPSDAHLVCEGPPLIAEACEGGQCAIGVITGEDDGSGKWGEWSPWTNCSEKCGRGVRRRRRVCLENITADSAETWGTHCVGQHDHFEICVNEDCVLNGKWSGWGAWGPCSQTCGAGRKSRTRTCTRPTPSGGGKKCIGARTEIGSCYLSPCDAPSHTVGIFSGDSHLHYNLQNKRAALVHFYVRFMVSSPHGSLLRRGAAQKPLVRLSLQKWHLCLDANSPNSCTLPQICSRSTLDPNVWHSALVTVTNAAATLRIDDASVAIKVVFTCDPDFEDEAMDIIIGEKLHGAIQEMALNFIPLIMSNDHARTVRSDFVPSSTTNVVYEKANIDEAFLSITDGQYLRLPCFEKEYWRLEFTARPQRESGLLTFMGDENAENYFYMALQNKRLKIKLALGRFKSESISFTECPPNQWFDVTLTKKREGNLIEATINSDEKIHIILDDVNVRRRHVVRNLKLQYRQCPLVNNHSRLAGDDKLKPDFLYICHDEFYFGGLPGDLQRRLTDDFTPFSGTLATLITDSDFQDLHQFNLERDQDGRIQVSSKTASISGSYHEVSWGKSNRLNLTCLHARSIRSPHTAQWLLLDTGMTGTLTNKKVRSVDDGRVLRLVAAADNDLRGFYTCRAHSNRRTRSVVTYGVRGKIKTSLTGPDTITIIAVITSLALLITTLSWLIIEGSNDLKSGFGFFRDAHLTPQEQAEAVCRYIDENLHMYASKSVAELAKEKARWKGQQLASRQSFAAQEPEGLNQITKKNNGNYSPSEPELPALPEIKNFMVEPSHDIYKYEPCYISSPRHGSLNTSPRTRLSSSSFEISSPRLLCSRLILARRIHSRDTFTSRHKITPSNRNFNAQSKPRSSLPTIKSSAYVNMSPARKVLQKFQQLKTEDT